MQKKNLFICLITFFLFTIFLPGFSMAQSDNPHFKRGKDWMDLKRYEKAISEFNMAIEEEPKNVDARYLIAESYYHQNRLLDAIAWLQETLSVDSNHAQAQILLENIKEKGIKLLSRPNPESQVLGLSVVQRFPSQKAVDNLKLLVGSKNENIASQAEYLLHRIDPNALRSAWRELLKSSDRVLRETAAEKLWITERFSEAAPVLREKYGRLFLSEERGAEEILLDLGYKDAVPILLQAIRIRVNWYKATEILTQHKEVQAVPVLIEAFSEEFWKRSSKARSNQESYQQWMRFVWALGELGGKDAIPVLKKALSQTVLRDPGRTGVIEEFLEALAKIEKEPAWKDLPYRFLRRVMSALYRLEFGTAKEKDMEHIDSNARKKVFLFVDKLGKCEKKDWKGNCKRALTISEYTKFEIKSSFQAELVGKIKDTNTKKICGSFTLELEVRGGTKKYWIVTDIRNVKIDGVNILQEFNMTNKNDRSKHQAEDNLYTIAVGLYNDGLIDLAREHFQNFLIEFPNSPHVPCIKFLLEQCDIRQKKRDVGIQDSQQIITENPCQSNITERKAETTSLNTEGTVWKRQVIYKPEQFPEVHLDRNMEVEIRLKFWVLPDGTVGEVIPLEPRGDIRLERAAITYLKNWRFNPLPPDSPKIWGIVPVKFTPK